MITSDAVVVTTVVAVDPAVAFAVFTEEVGAWWKQGPRFRVRPDRSSTVRFELFLNPRVSAKALSSSSPKKNE